MLGAAKVAQLEDSRLRIEQKILGEKKGHNFYAFNAMTALPEA